MFTAREPGTGGAWNRSVEIGDARTGRVALLERGGIQQRLECRASLSLSLHCAVERAVMKIASTHQRKYVARTRIDRHKPRLYARGAGKRLRLRIEFGKTSDDSVLRRLLQAHVHRRVDA